MQKKLKEFSFSFESFSSVWFRKTKPYGNKGNDLVITVPTGITAVTDSNVTIGELNTEDEQILLVKGGQGGSSFNNYRGQPGQAFSVSLYLKIKM